MDCYYLYTQRKTFKHSGIFRNCVPVLPFNKHRHSICERAICHDSISIKCKCSYFPVFLCKITYVCCATKVFMCALYIACGGILFRYCVPVIPPINKHIFTLDCVSVPGRQFPISHWISNEDLAFTNQVQYRHGRIVILEAGLYYVYSQLAFLEVFDTPGAMVDTGAQSLSHYIYR